jgi:hypothetical protein
MIAHTMEERLTPRSFADAYRSVTRVEEIMPAIRAMAVETADINMMPRPGNLADKT